MSRINQICLKDLGYVYISTIPRFTGDPKSISLNVICAYGTVINQGVEDWGKIFPYAI